MAWRRGVVTMVVVVVLVVVVPAPKWNDKGRMSQGGVRGRGEGGVRGEGRIQPMRSTYPIVVVVVGMTGGRWWIHDLLVNPMV